jgi:hypothetical protein
VQAMVDIITAQRDVEYFNELLSKETDENQRAILQRLLAEAEKMRRMAEREEEKQQENKRQPSQQ